MKDEAASSARPFGGGLPHPADAQAATSGQSSTDNERGSASTEKAPSVSPARSDR